MKRDPFSKHAYLASLLFLMVVLLYPVNLFSGEESYRYPKSMAGFQAGYSQVAGYWHAQLKDAAGFNAYVIPYSFWFLLGEIDFHYASYRLRQSSSSTISSSTIGAGPLFFYPVFSFLEVYAGISAQFSFLYLRAMRLGEQERSVKPGFALKTGFFFPLPWGVVARLGFEYSMMPLSGEYLQSINYFAGVSYNFSFLVYSGKAEEDAAAGNIAKAEGLYRAGLSEMKSGNVKAARKDFSDVLVLNPEHAEAKKLGGLLEDKEGTLQSAEALLGQKQYFKAIPLLEDAGTHIPEAKEKLNGIRERLFADIPKLEKEGISAYEAKEYERCIDIMHRIKLIQPGNNTANIYLPRAKLRYEALRKLK